MMKRRYMAWILCLAALLLTACGAPEEKGEPAAEPLPAAQPVETDADRSAAEPVSVPQGSESPEERPVVTLSLRIVDGAGTGQLVLAGETAESVYTLAADGVPVLLDGQLADASALEDGMMAELRCLEPDGQEGGTLGGVETISVHSLGSRENPGGGTYDLCGLYLQVLDDLWEADSGLNGGITYLSVDLSGAPGGLTEGEQAAVARIFARRHEAEPLTLTYAELESQGYLTEHTLPGGDGERTYCTWEDGVLFSITPHETGGEEAWSLPVLRFDAQKWRTPLGAYYFSDCTAVWPEMGACDSYTVGAELIS